MDKTSVVENATRSPSPSERASNEAWFSSEPAAWKARDQNLVEFGKGVVVGSINATEGFIEFLATPDSVNNALIGFGQALDTAANYYAFRPTDKIAQDAQEMATTCAKSLHEYGELSAFKRGQICGTVATNVFAAELLGSVSRLGESSFGVADSIETDPLRSMRLRYRSGAGGEWTVMNERPAADVIQQLEFNSCVSACGEMLSDGRVSQARLMEFFEHEYGDQDLLPNLLGGDWNAGYVGPDYLPELMERRCPFSAELRDKKNWGYPKEPSHQVIVDGRDHNGNFEIRDPQHGTRYEMTPEDFKEVWTGRAVYNKAKRR